MSRVFQCDICGKVNPRIIRSLIAYNPDVSDTPLNKEEFYGFNLFHDDLCDECLNKLERGIAKMLDEMRKEKKTK